MFVCEKDLEVKLSYFPIDVNLSGYMFGVWQLGKKLNQYGYNTTRGLTRSSTVVAVYGFPPS